MELALQQLTLVEGQMVSGDVRMIERMPLFAQARLNGLKERSQLSQLWKCFIIKYLRILV
jgi:hypothetical protein